MSDPENALPLIREILPDVDIQGIRIIEAESTHESLPGSKGVRYDIYINDVNGRGYVIEMQASDTDELPLRSRYYSSMMDMGLLEKGNHYKDLMASYVVFICPFDLFGLSLHKYVFHNTCVQAPKLCLEDNRNIIFLNAVGTAKDVSAPLERFLNYVAGKKGDIDNYIKQIDNAVKTAKKNVSWRLQYMEWRMEMENERRKAREQGLQEGLEQGREQGLKQGLEQGLQEGLEQGLEQGREQGLEQGRHIALVSLVNEGLISTQTAAMQEGITEEEFKKRSILLNLKS